jgi:hypothetical protein
VVPPSEKGGLAVVIAMAVIKSEQTELQWRGLGAFSTVNSIHYFP